MFVSAVNSRAVGGHQKRMMTPLLLLSTLWFADVAVPHGALPATAGERHAAAYRALLRALAPMVDAGELQVAIREGIMRVILPADELFESSKSQLLPDGRKRMVALARALTTVPARRLSVIAYTDTTPPDEGTTNAALSSARALTIREVLARGKIAVAAMGRGEREPIASNDYEEGRRQNRRIEVLVHVD
jgi:flagellar motor protein MotB